MKDLDQPSRALLRKYGVRFGAYHIYFPALLKPAARALASLLWAEKESNVDLVGAVGRAASGGLGPHVFPGRQDACRAMPIACSAIASAASAPCASTFWSGSPI